MKAFRQPRVLVRRAEMSDSDALADIHASAFHRGWSNAEFELLLVQPSTRALIAHYRNALGRQIAGGFILYRVVGDEAEILSVAVAPKCRRRGIGRALVDEALRHLYRDGVNAIHLEVEDGNIPAIALYRSVEFRESGRREGYYKEGRQTSVSALVMRRQHRQPLPRRVK